MQIDKILSMLGLARRAGALSMGHDMAAKAIYASKAKLLLFAEDASERVKNEFAVTLEKQKCDIPVYILPATISQIHFSCGYKAGIITVNDSNFSSKIISLLNE